MFMQNSQAFRFAERIAIGDLGPDLRPSGRMAGILAATRIETTRGWCAARDLLPGLRVPTFDGGVATIRRVGRQALPDGTVEMIRIPGGALNNCSDLWLLPDQRLLLADALAEELFDTVAVQVPAHCLEGYRGIARMRRPGGGLAITLSFDQDEAVFANTGTLIYFDGERPEAQPFYPRPATPDIAAFLQAMERSAACWPGQEAA